MFLIEILFDWAKLCSMCLTRLQLPSKIAPLQFITSASEFNADSAASRHGVERD